MNNYTIVGIMFLRAIIFAIVFFFFFLGLFYVAEENTICTFDNGTEMSKRSFIDEYSEKEFFGIKRVIDMNDFDQSIECELRGRNDRKQ